MKRWLRILAPALSLAILAIAANTQTPAKSLDPILAMVKSIEDGKSQINFDKRHGYLKGLLKSLDISPASQTLVWSKTSLQGPRIGPRNPRAIYFNDHTYVGWVNGGELIEIATVHPEKGTRFYSIRNQDASKLEVQDEFQRCIACHAGPGLGGVPRLLSRSVNADPQGYQILRGGGRVITPKTPISERWGGWYVSGTHGTMRHRGNSPAVGDDDGFKFDPEPGANKTDLSRSFDTEQYLSPHSDIVALMVLDHQMHVQNDIIRAGNQTRKIEEDSSLGTIAEVCEPLVESLLCYGEVKLDAPVKGMGAFQAEYEKASALKKLNLQTRLLAVRLSPMIETASFEGLPVAAKRQVVSRLWKAADPEAGESKYSYLEAAEKAAIRKFLAASKLASFVHRSS